VRYASNHVCTADAEASGFEIRQTKGKQRKAKESNAHPGRLLYVFLLDRQSSKVDLHLGNPDNQDNLGLGQYGVVPTVIQNSCQGCQEAKLTPRSSRGGPLNHLEAVAL
jgi:hypothetical protein